MAAGIRELPLGRREKFASMARFGGGRGRTKGGRGGIGGAGSATKDASIDYTITVPADAEIRAVTGSGDLEIIGLKGPANFVAGSGDIKASKITGDVQITAGSGSIELSEE